MKKFTVLLLALMLLLCSCTESIEYEGETETQSVTKETVDTSYESIERYQSSGYSNGYYGFAVDSAVINITYPREWSFRQGGGGFDIVRGKNTVGRLIGAQASDTSEWTVLKTEEDMQSDVSTKMIIERKSTDGESSYRYRYVYTYTTDGVSRTITLTADCAELDKMTEAKLFMNTFFEEKVTSKTLGILSNIGDPSSVLILGNSFIGSSDIGDILREMLNLNGKSCSVTAISRGYATVDTYINDASILSAIKSGSYDAVFICGFYSSNEVANLGVLKSACDTSRTQLVIFPAHNESSGVVSSAQSKYSSLVCLNWKNELDGLIRKGVDRWDLCTDDQHDHSKPLAGYVGAHMIYRAIYGELPLRAMQNAISQVYVDKILGDYAYVGDTETLDETKITYFSN